MENQKKGNGGAHILAIPFPAPGHMNPLIQFCKRLVFKGGVKATVAITRYQAKSIQTRLDTIQIDTISDGYDEGGFYVIDSIEDSIEKFKVAGSQTLAELIEKYEKLGNPIDCIIYDAFLPWVLDVAKKFGKIVAAFFTQPCAVNCINYHVYHKLLPYPFSSPPISVSGLPPLNLEDMPGFIYVDPGHYVLVQSQFSKADEADYRFVNTFYDLEAEAVDAMKKIHSLRTIGPTVPSFYLDKRVPNDSNYGLHSSNLIMQQKKSTSTPDADPLACLDWLSTKPPRSVVYVSFGSVAVASPVSEEMKEIAWGLRNSNCFFLWVVKGNEEPNLPENFKEETADKGMIIPWSPQLEVLAHEATGCFITHCGWNSTIESLCLGVPMVAMPKWADQTTNAKYIEDVWKAGVRAKVGENGVASREEIERCIRAVLEGESGKYYKSNAMKWKDLATHAVSEGGTSDKNIAEFLSELKAR